MKRVIETDDGGFDAMLGKRVCFFCGVYIYAGILAGVNDDHLELDEPKLVYDTGPLMDTEWADAQSLPAPWRVMRQSVESWGAAKC